MYRVKKVLNHNAVIGIHGDTNQEYLILGKGAGFGKKISERIEKRAGDMVYSLQESTERGDSGKLVNSIDPLYLEIANEVLDEAEKVFKTLDRNVLFPLADHMEYAVKRIQNHEQISNPLTEDIRILFYMEYKVAQSVQPILRERMGIEMDDDEIGYISLHIHSAIQDENVSQAMQIARAVRECITLVEQEIGRPIDVLSLSYNRLMNHIRYMVARVLNKEQLKLNMNDYMEIKFPKAFQLARYICDEVGLMLKCSIDQVEIGYLAMHIERVTSDETGNH
ncbi:MAG: PRD domain-containing protein [Lachnospiraceae bacterium]|nr:PRD domain-containing protein [Lachnospiraceae bacterium]